MITLIAAVAENNAIGKGDQLLWHLPEDFKHFKRLTHYNGTEDFRDVPEAFA